VRVAGDGFHAFELLLGHHENVAQVLVPGWGAIGRAPRELPVSRFARHPRPRRLLFFFQGGRKQPLGGIRLAENMGSEVTRGVDSPGNGDFSVFAPRTTY